MQITLSFRFFLLILSGFYLLTLSLHVHALPEAEKQARLEHIKTLKARGEIVFAIVPKNTNIPFFKAAGEGCETTAKELGVHCVFYGSTEDNAFKQIADIMDLVNAGIDGIAISQFIDGWIKKRIGQELTAWNKPIISFDAPINASFVSSYVGSDNYALGLALGKQVRLLRPEGGTYCIHTEHQNSPNHMTRMKGILDALIDEDNQSLWKNATACPLFHDGNLEAGILQMKRALEWTNVDTFLLTGGGPQFLLDQYKDLMTPYKTSIQEGNLVIASIDTTPNQMIHLRNGLSNLNIGQKPYNMGVVSAKTLYQLHQGQPVSPIIYTGMSICNQDNFETCLLAD